MKWLGYKSCENTWEPEENLDCANLIEQFEVQRRKKNMKKSHGSFVHIVCYFINFMLNADEFKCNFHIFLFYCLAGNGKRSQKLKTNKHNAKQQSTRANTDVDAAASAAVIGFKFDCGFIPGKILGAGTETCGTLLKTCGFELKQMIRMKSN